MKIFSKIRRRISGIARIPERLDIVQEALGRIESRLNQGNSGGNPRDYEFKVYSQWGEDGIIDCITQNIKGLRPTFVEFGVETYIEANTLFLLKHRNWSGLVIDGSDSNIETIRRSHTFWKHHLMAHSAFIDRNNINSIIEKNGFTGELGLLSIDIDGNDYWIWEAINVVSPAIVIAEYNSLFGDTATVSTPYKDSFQRSLEHGSNLYYGASISALALLAEKRNYSLVAGNSAGNNAFFVRKDLLGDLVPMTPKQAYVQAAFRESRNEKGDVIRFGFSERQSAIEELPLIDVATGETTCLKKLKQGER
jgi:hypothetical protein